MKMITFKRGFRVRSLGLLLAVSCALSFSPLRLAAAEGSADEDASIKVLESAATPREKDLACANLKRVGTDKCIPALAALLRDPQLSHSARYVLEPMSSPQAGKVLIDALGETTNDTRLGIIGSLAVRRDEPAVPALEKLLTDPDNQTAVASAVALGRISGEDALKALDQASSKTSGKVQAACYSGLLHCANRLIGTRRQSVALKAFQDLYTSATAANSLKSAPTKA
jgi:HEAT repeat protein